MTSLLLDLVQEPARLRLDQADAVEWLRSLPPESVALIVTDPAYESLEQHRNHGTTVRLKDWFPIFPDSRMKELLVALHRVLKQDSHCYLMCDQPTGLFLYQLNQQLQLFTFHKFLVWDKKSIGTGYHYRAQHEWIAFLSKGTRPLASRSISDVLRFKRIRNVYPTQKPVELMSVLIEQSSLPGDVVADCFAGSGAAGAAALALGRRFWGADISERAIAICKERLAA